MSDIFLSYASPDRPRLRPLIKALEERGWSVFWDRAIAIGQAWPAVLGHELSICSCVVVVWTHSSVLSPWVYEEAEEGKKKSALFPVVLDAVSPPLGFRMYQTADLIGWAGEQEHASFSQLCLDIASHLKFKQLKRTQEEQQQAAEQRLQAELAKREAQAKHDLAVQQARQQQAEHQLIAADNAQQAAQARQRLISEQAKPQEPVLNTDSTQAQTNEGHTLGESAAKTIDQAAVVLASSSSSTAAINHDSTVPHLPPAFVPDEASLLQAKQQLAYYLGPVARLLVPRVAKRATSHEHFIQLLANELTDDKQRLAFMRRMSS